MCEAPCCKDKEQSKVVQARSGQNKEAEEAPGDRRIRASNQGIGSTSKNGWQSRVHGGSRRRAAPRRLIHAGLCGHANHRRGRAEYALRLALQHLCACSRSRQPSPQSGRAGPGGVRPQQGAPGWRGRRPYWGLTRRTKSRIRGLTRWGASSWGQLHRWRYRSLWG